MTSDVPFSPRRKISEVKVAQSCPTLCDPMDHSPLNSPGQNTGVGSLSLLQGIFPTQGSNPGFPHGPRILSQLSQRGNRGNMIPFKAQIFKGLKENNNDWALCDIPGTVLVTLDRFKQSRGIGTIVVPMLYKRILRQGEWNDLPKALSWWLPWDWNWGRLALGKVPSTRSACSSKLSRELIQEFL